MYQQLADVGSHLNEENLAVVVPQPPPDCLDERNVETGRNVVLVERRVPTVVDPDTLPPQDRPKEIYFQDFHPAGKGRSTSGAVMSQRIPNPMVETCAAGLLSAEIFDCGGCADCILALYVSPHQREF
jgi:hypothetical protein